MPPIASKSYLPAISNIKGGYFDELVLESAEEDNNNDPQDYWMND